MSARLAAALLLACAGGAAAQEPRVVIAGQGTPWQIVGIRAQAPLAERLLERTRALGPLPALPPEVLDPAHPIRIELAENESTFRRLTGDATPDWGAGVAFPARGIVVLPTFASPRGNMGDLPLVLRHEIAHVALERALSPAAVPRWFTEGYATWAAGQLDLEAGWLLRLAFLTGRAPPLDSLVLGWPGGAADARVAYLLSASAVEWLHDRGGDRALGLFLDRWQEGGRLEQALRATYGLTLGQFERYWITSVRRRFGWLLFFAQASVAWAVLTLLALVLFIVRRRRDRRRLQRLRETEPPDTPAFWLETQGEERPDNAGAAGPDGDGATSAPPAGA